MVRTMIKTAAGAFLVLCLGLAQDARAGLTQTYLSLGDSLDFGETVFQDNSALGPYSDPSYCTNRGYVGLFANYLASQNGGVAPNVINLGVDGETSSSFTSGVGRVPPGAGYTDASLDQLNLNYTGATPPTQASLLASTLASQAAGHVISNVSISIGSNGLYTLALSDPNAITDLPAALNAFQANYASLLAQVRAGLPGTNIDLIGTYNPYLTGAPTSTFAPSADYAIPQLNNVIHVLATEFNANYIDTYGTVLTPDPTDYALISEGDAHPNFDLGYGVIDGQMEAAVVPEPSSLTLVALGLGGLIGGRIVSRRRIAR